MARSVKRVVLVLLAAAVLAFAAWMLWPRSIGDAVTGWCRGISGTAQCCANSSPLSSGANRGLQTESRVFIMRGLSGADSPIFVCFGRDLL